MCLLTGVYLHLLCLLTGVKVTLLCLLTGVRFTLVCFSCWGCLWVGMHGCGVGWRLDVWGHGDCGWIIKQAREREIATENERDREIDR